MSILTPIPFARNVNPRDLWPDWTDLDRWELGPETDDFRPTADPSYYPTLDEENDARELFDDAADDEPSDSEWDAMADDAAALDAVCSGLSWL